MLLLWRAIDLHRKGIGWSGTTPAPWPDPEAGTARQGAPMTPREKQDAEILATMIDGLAQRMYRAYNDQGPNPWRTFDGRSVPPWDQITDQVQGKWRAAAALAIEEAARD